MLQDGHEFCLNDATMTSQSVGKSESLTLSLILLEAQNAVVASLYCLIKGITSVK